MRAHMDLVPAMAHIIFDTLCFTSFNTPLKLILQPRLNVGQEPCDSQGEDSESGLLAFSRAFHNLPFPSKNKVQHFLQNSKNVEILKTLNL